MSWVASVSTLEVTYLFDINCCGQMTVVHKTAPPTGDETNITSDKQSAGNSHTDGLVSVFISFRAHDCSILDTTDTFLQ